MDSRKMIVSEIHRKWDLKWGSKTGVGEGNTRKTIFCRESRNRRQ